VYEWHKQFLEGREGVENESHRCCPRTSVIKTNICIVGRFFENDRRLTVAEIASEIRISYSNAQKISMRCYPAARQCPAAYSCPKSTKNWVCSGLH